MYTCKPGHGAPPVCDEDIFAAVNNSEETAQLISQVFDSYLDHCILTPALY